MRKYTIEDAKRLISDFCEEEYGTDNVDFSDLSCIGLAYTNTEDECYDVQTNVDLQNCKINYCLNGECIKTERYFSITDLCIRALNCLAFEWLIEPQIDYYNKILEVAL